MKKTNTTNKRTKLSATANSARKKSSSKLTASGSHTAKKVKSKARHSLIVAKSLASNTVEALRSPKVREARGTITDELSTAIKQDATDARERVASGAQRITRNVEKSARATGARIRKYAKENPGKATMIAAVAAAGAAGGIMYALSRRAKRAAGHKQR